MDSPLSPTKSYGGSLERRSVSFPDDQAAAVTEDIELLTAQPYLSPVTNIAGFVFNVESGEISDVVRWERPE